MLFLTDENVPDAVGRFFRNIGHDVQLARETFREGTSDQALVEGAEVLHATIITWNRKDFDRLISRRPPDGNHQRYRHVGAMYFRCNEPAAVRRLEQLVELLQLEIDLCSQRSDQRIFVEIDTGYIKIDR